MDRRSWMGAAAALAGGSLLQRTAAAAGLESLPRSPRMPVLFVGHGSPMNAIEDNEFRRAWQALGAEFGSSWPRPQVILCVSAHWLTRGWQLTAMEKPRTIHDFGGFPRALFEQEYAAPGAPAVARALAAQVREPRLGLDEGEWGFDHGTWSVLKPMFPAAAELAEFQKLGQLAQLAHPTHDHYLPLLHAAGAADTGEQMRFFSERFQSASISMRSVVWG